MFTLAGIGSLFASLWANIKWIAIIVGILAVLLVGWKFYDLTSENAAYEAKITNLNGIIASKDLSIELYQAKAKSVEDALNQRDQEERDALEKLKDLQLNLPADNNDLAPPSTQEFFNRLSKQLP